MSFAFLRRSLEVGRAAQWPNKPTVVVSRETHEKRCSRCNEVKDILDFYPNPKPTLTSKRRAECKLCTRLYQKRNYDKVRNVIPHSPGRDRTPAGEGAEA